MRKSEYPGKPALHMRFTESQVTSEFILSERSESKGIPSGVPKGTEVIKISNYLRPFSEYTDTRVVITIDVTGLHMIIVERRGSRRMWSLPFNRRQA